MDPTLSQRRMPRALPSLLVSAFFTVQALAQGLAQPTPTARRPDPLDHRAAVPALRHESATAPYRRLTDEKTVPWRDANEAVARIGGWRVYAREAQQADPPASAPASTPAATPPAEKPSGGTPADMTHRPMPAGHGGHSQRPQQP